MNRMSVEMTFGNDTLKSESQALRQTSIGHWLIHSTWWHETSIVVFWRESPDHCEGFAWELPQYGMHNCWLYRGVEKIERGFSAKKSSLLRFVVHLLLCCLRGVPISWNYEKHEFKAVLYELGRLNMNCGHSFDKTVKLFSGCFLTRWMHSSIWRCFKM